MDNRQPQYTVPQLQGEQDYEMNTFTNTQNLGNTNPSIVYYNPVENNDQFDNTEQVYLPAYTVPVVLNSNPIINQQVPAIQVVTHPVATSHCENNNNNRCCNNMPPHEMRLHRSVAILKFYLVTLLILAMVSGFIFYFDGFVLYYILLSVHFIMIIAGMVGARRKSTCTLVMLMIWLCFTFGVCTRVLISLISQVKHFTFYHFYFGINMFFMFTAIVASLRVIYRAKQVREYSRLE